MTRFTPCAKHRKVTKMSRQDRVEDLNIPVRTKRLLAGAGLLTIKQLLGAPSSQILDVLHPDEYDELVGTLRTFQYVDTDVCHYRDVQRHDRRILAETPFGSLTTSWLATYRQLH